MQNVEISSHDHGDHGEYRARVVGTEARGELTWREHGGVRCADHTYVPPELRGHGIAAELVRAMVDDARANGFMIRPVCSYVVTAFDRHPEWADVRA